MEALDNQRVQIYSIKESKFLTQKPQLKIHNFYLQLKIKTLLVNNRLKHDPLLILVKQSRQLYFYTPIVNQQFQV